MSYFILNYIVHYKNIIKQILNYYVIYDILLRKRDFHNVMALTEIIIEVKNTSHVPKALQY